MKLLLLLSLLTSTAQAFTLNNNFGASFKDSKVNVYVDVQTTCSNAGVTIYELEDLVKEATASYWNTVATSSLRLKPAGFSSATSNISTGRLCSATDDACIAAAQGAGNLIPPVNDIVIACNDLDANFGGAGVLAVTIPNKFSGKKIAGAVILLNNDSSPPTNFANLSRSDKIAVLAHELGHAIGLGHAKGSEALMYYKTVKLRRNLSQDDIDGVSFLYPVTLDACGLFATVEQPRGGGPPFLQMALTLGLFVLLIELRRLLNRAKARTPA